MKLVIIKYNAGNIQSVLYALERIGREAVVTDDPVAIREADKVIFPGVGEASTAMDYLRERGLDAVIRGLSQPVLGICLGMQLMCSYSEENDTACLGIFEEKVRLLSRMRDCGACTWWTSTAPRQGRSGTGRCWRRWPARPVLSSILGVASRPRLMWILFLIPVRRWLRL